MTGLSPRVRGNLAPTLLTVTNLRSIPACAGEPLPNQILPRALKVYPRVCGGTVTDIEAICNVMGLSPRVRGNRYNFSPDKISVRSIPACAGEPAITAAGHLLARVYPRVCGGTSDAASHVPDVAGLSPRVRGNPEAAAEVSFNARSIPACAGEPPFVLEPPSRSSVYPRVCGGTA